MGLTDGSWLVLLEAVRTAAIVFGVIFGLYQLREQSPREIRRVCAELLR